MRVSFKSVVAGVSTLAVAGVIAAAGASSAAAVTPPYDPDPDAYATVTFYDATGNVVTSGDGNSNQSPKYVVANGAKPAGTNSIAGIFLYAPQPNQPTGLFPGTQLSKNTIYPLPGAPAPVGTSTNAASQMDTATARGIFSATKDFVANTGTLTNLFQIRLKSSGGSTAYAASTISVDPVTGAWTQVYPVPPVVTPGSTTSLAVSPASPVNAPANPTLTATVAPVAAGTPVAGSVEFFNGATSLGSSPVASGVATKSLSGVAAGTYGYTATFTPTDPTVIAGSTSSALSYVVQTPKPTPSVSLAASNSAPTVGSPVTFTANIGQVAGANVPGTVEFYEGTTLLGAPVAAAGGVATLTTSALTAGTKSVTAKFVPADPAAFNGATSAAITVNVQAVLVGACANPGSVCTDPQGFTVVVPVGTLVISTPFTAANPFNLGTMALNANATELSTVPKSFKGQDPAGKGITITDGRSGNLPWTANLQSSDFVKGTTDTIAAKNLGFTGVTPTYLPNNALQAPAVSVFDNPANSVANPLPGLSAASKFASAVHGAGSVYVDGLFTLNAPTSTPAGTYTGTVTFTVG